MEQPTTSYFREIINSFVNFQPTQQNKATHKQIQLTIETFTKTKECWKIIFDILNTETNPSVLTLASSIIKNKFQYDFSQLTPQMFQKAHQSLVHIIAKFNKPSNSVRFNFSVAVAIIYIHKASEIGDLLNYLSQQLLPSTDRNYLFTILEVLPEEIDNEKIVVDEEKRVQLRRYMESIQKNVLVQLNNISNIHWETGEIKHSTLIKCFSNWIRVGADKDVIMNLHNHFLMEIAFNGLSDSDISQESASCIQFVIRAITDPHEYGTVYGYIAKKIISFFGKIKQLLDDDCIEMCQEMIKLICIFGISSKDQFTTNKVDDYKEFIKNMVLLTEVSQLEFAIFFQEFWIQFLTIIIEKEQNSDFYSQHLKELYIVLSKSLTFETSQCEQLNRQSSNELQKVNKQFETKLVYRLEYKALFNLLAQVLVPETCLILSLSTINNLKSTDSKYWVQMESYMNPLEQVIEQLPDSSSYLNTLVSKLVQITPPYQTVKKTIIRILSASSRLYSKNNEFALKIFEHLIEHMKSPDMSIIACKAFENLCVYNVDFVLSHIDSFIQTLLIYKDNEQILNGIIKVLKNNQDAFKKYIPSIFLMYTSELPKASSIKNVKLVLDKVILIFDKVTQSGNNKTYIMIMSECFLQIWRKIKPILQTKCTSYEDQSLLEKCTKVIKYAMRCLKEQFQPYIDGVYTVVLESYRNDPKSSYVYMVEVLITVYYDNPQFLPYINDLFEKIIQITFSYLNSLDQIMELPKLSEDFFGLLSRILRFIPQVFFSSKHIQLLLNFITQSCGIDDGEIARIFYNLLIDFYMQYWDRNLVVDYIEQEGLKDKIVIKQSPQLVQLLKNVKPLIVSQSLSIVKKMITHLQTVPSTTVRSCIVGALISEVKAFSNENRQLWIQMLTPITEDILTVSEKSKILESVSQLTKDNIDYAEEMFYLMTKRYLHRLTRSPI